MMQVKKFRAATTREALEQIKKELGQDAFVLETRQVRKSGFLGLGKGAMEIEISAAAAPASKSPAAKPALELATEVAPETEQRLFLRDDAPAAPAATVGPATPALLTESALSNGKQTTEKDLLNILAAKGFTRKEMGAEEETFNFDNMFSRRSASFEPAEIASEAPQIVHPKKETVKPSFDEQDFAPISSSSSNTSVTVETRELEFLRAELREVKFALGKIALRTNGAEYQKAQDPEFLGDSYDSPFHEAYIELAALGIPYEMAKSIIIDIIPDLRGSIRSEEDIARLALTSALESRLSFAINPLQPDGERIVAFVGPTGVGKTTTIAKLAARVALQQGRRVELVALDTYRIGAVEQLKTYAEIIGAGCHTVRSVLELDALLRKLPQDATILIDSTGKSPHDLADQYALAEYLRLNDEIKKCLVIQANTHPVDAAAAIRKFAIYGPDYLTITKFDETERPGALLEVMSESALPLAYFCMGQRVPEDLQEATLRNMVSRIFPKTN